jgi:hypothetical protein
MLLPQPMPPLLFSEFELTTPDLAAFFPDFFAAFFCAGCGADGCEGLISKVWAQAGMAANASQQQTGNNIFRTTELMIFSITAYWDATRRDTGSRNYRKPDSIRTARNPSELRI